MPFSKRPIDLKKVNAAVPGNALCRRRDEQSSACPRRAASAADALLGIDAIVPFVGTVFSSSSFILLG